MDGKQGSFRHDPGLPALPRNGKASSWPPGRPEDCVSTLQTLTQQMRLVLYESCFKLRYCSIIIELNDLPSQVESSK